MAAKPQKIGSTNFYMHFLSTQLHMLTSFTEQNKIPFLNEFGLYP